MFGLELLFAFLIGVASSGVVAYVVYRQQRRDSAISEQRLAYLMERALKVTEGASEVLHSTVNVIDQRQRDVQEEISELRSSFTSALQSFVHDLARPLPRPSRRSLRLSVDDLRELHRRLMPTSTAHAGTLRDSQVRIAGSEQKPPAPADVPGMLEKVLRSWNDDAESLQSLSREEQVRHLARFHHRLVSIHPFLDGNGALARALLSMQIRALTGVSRLLAFGQRDQYFSALRAADSGDLQPLEGLISDFITRGSG